MRIKVKISSLLTWISLMIVTVPDGIRLMFPFVNTLLFAARLVVLICELYVYYTMRNQLRMSKIIYLEFFFAVAILFSTLCNHGDIFRAIKISYNIIVSSMWADICFQKDFKDSARIVSRWLYILLFINCLCSIVWPNGFFEDTSYSFLTLTNHMPMYWIAGFAFYYLQNYLTKKTLGASILKISILILIPSLIYDNMTGVIILLFLVSVCIWENYFVHKKRTRSIVFWIVVLAMGFSTLVLMNTREGMNSSLLQKYWTLQARVELWTRTMQMVLQRLIIGWGVGETDAIIYYNQWLNYPPHNTFLAVSLWGGICGLAFFIGLFTVSMKGVRKVQRKIGSPLLMSCVGYLIYLMMETTTSMNLLFIFLLAVQHIQRNRSIVEKGN